MAEKTIPSVWERLTGRFIDGLILGPIAITILIMEGLDNSLKYQSLVILVNFAYEAFMLKKYGQTIGKKIVHIKVVGKNKSGLTWGEITKRILGVYIPGNLATALHLNFLSFVWLAVLGITIYTDKKGQGLHDKFAGTRVVSV